MSEPSAMDAIMASIRDSVAGDAPIPDPDAPRPVPAIAAPASAPADGITLDALVRSLLAPMLRDWLDAHLPEIVEAATHAEIRRLTGLGD